MATNEALTPAIMGRCPCGASSIAIEQMPKVRFYCHCTICQSVYPGNYGDATLMLAKKVKVQTPDTIEFTRHLQKGGLERGTCKSCKHPVMALLDGPGLPQLAFVPAAVIPDQADKPKSARHIFYGTRTVDVDDNLPKTNGDKASMLVFTPSVLRVVFSG